MKLSTSFLLLSSLVVSGNAISKPGKWNLIWSEEFEGNSINSNFWSHEVNCWGGGNNESQCYTSNPANSFIRDGRLHIVALEELTSGPDGPNGEGPITTLPFSSARLNTKDKFMLKYGKICARAKLPSGQGAWPAIWMLPNNPEYTWAVDGEIDIMEAVNLPKEHHKSSKIHGTLHYGGAWPLNVHSGTDVTLSPDKHPSYHFNTYCIEWEEGEIRWFVNDEHYATQRQWYSEKPDGSVIQSPTPFNEEFFIILNLAVGGNWPGSPDQSTQFPMTMEIDWIRAYKCSTGTPTGKGCNSVDSESKLVSGYID